MDKVHGGVGDGNTPRQEVAPHLVQVTARNTASSHRTSNSRLFAFLLIANRVGTIIVTYALSMSVGFGFSAGDFIAALDLVATVIDALRDSGDSSAEYRELVAQLFSLETALRAVERIELDDVQIGEVIALQQAAAQCQRTIDAFWQKIKKYHPSLGRGTGSRVRDGWMKIKWALCRKEDLVRFKADLVGHTESIEMLLTTVQM
jgi:hypothetical protein